MPNVPFSDDDQRRLSAFAKACKSCREATRVISLDSAMIEPRDDSQASRDIEYLKARSDRPETYGIVITTVQPQLLAAGELIGTLGLIYDHRETLFAPLVIARTIVEYCAHIIWILGSKDSLTEARVARAFLDEINGLAQAQKATGFQFGEDSDQYRGRSRARDMKTQSATELFGRFRKVKAAGSSRQYLGPEFLPGHAELVVEAVRIMSSGSSADHEIKGAYALLSNNSHAAAITIWDHIRHADDGTTFIAEDIRLHDTLVRFMVALYYDALSRVLSYSDVQSEYHSRLSWLLDQLLPGFFAGPNQSGPYARAQAGDRAPFIEQDGTTADAKDLA